MRLAIAAHGCGGLGAWIKNTFEAKFFSEIYQLFVTLRATSVDYDPKNERCPADKSWLNAV